jgi:hypothetical protein
MSELLTIKTLSLSRDEIALGASRLDDECLLTKQQAAVFLAVSERTIDAMMANLRAARKRRRLPAAKGYPRTRERLKFIKIGHQVRFQLGDLRRFLDERKEGIDQTRRAA